MRGNKIYVPLITPFKPDGSVDYNSYGKAVEFVLKSGAEGIYAMGSSAECFMLTEQERKKGLEAIIEAANGKPVIAHIGHISQDIAEDLLRHAYRAGATLGASVPPFYYNFSLKEVKSYFDSLAVAVDMPLMIYNIPSKTRAFSVDELIMLLKNEKITSIKFTDTDYYYLNRLKTLTDKTVLSGCDECFLSAVSAGADGAIGTTFNYMAETYMDIRQHYKEGRAQEALALQTRANNITQLIKEGNPFSVTKYIMTLMGLDINPSARKPFSELSKEHKMQIENQLSQNGFI